MDFAYTDADEALRREVRAFLAAQLPADAEERRYQTGDTHDAAFCLALAERGWFAPDWPGEDGTTTLDAVGVHILTEELTRVDAPMYAAATTMMVAKVIRAAGSPELQAELLPAVLRGEVAIALGMTEPEAGSDVAAIQTRARRDGDEWVIDGQKMFTTNAHVADYVFLLARTDPDSKRHRGITTFLVPLDHPGVEVQAVRTLGGERTNITYYSEVRLADRWRISDVGLGWGSLMLALQDEHSAPFSPHLDRILEEAEAWAFEPDDDGARPIEQAEVRRRLVAAAIDLEVAQLLEARTTWMEGQGEVPLAEGPMSKLFSTEAVVRRADDLAALVGPDALRSRGEPTAVRGGHIEHGLRFAQGTTIYAGTSEVQRNIIAQHRCGLPRP